MTYHKKTFENIAAEKRSRILNTAIEEFAALGYNAASINVIARKAGISIGSMYSYFESKEALFITALDRAHDVLEEALEEVRQAEGDFFVKMRRMIDVSQEFAVKYKALNQMYIDLSTEALSHLSTRTSLKTEGATVVLYNEVLEMAIENGLVRRDLDKGIIAFCVDSLVMMAQFAHASDFYRERLRIFTGIDAESDPAAITEGLMRFMEYGLKGPGCGGKAAE